MGDLLQHGSDAPAVATSATHVRGIRRAARRTARLPRRLLRQVEGASMAEYALLLGVIVIVLVVVISRFSGEVGGLFSRTNVALSSTDAGGAGGDNGRGSCGNPPCGLGPDGSGPPGPRP